MKGLDDMNTLTARDIRDMFVQVATAVIASEEYLCEADRRIGDGDHGIGMRRGFTAVLGRLDVVGDGASALEVVNAVGRTMIGEMGGASGVMFGLMFAGAHRVSTDDDLSLRTWTAAQRAALEQITSRGGAAPGDKTMVDALQPAVVALETALTDGVDLAGALRIAASAAETGADATRSMTARFGKARTLGERALGHPDPGALTVSIIHRAMSDWMEQHLLQASVRAGKEAI